MNSDHIVIITTNPFSFFKCRRVGDYRINVAGLGQDAGEGEGRAWGGFRGGAEALDQTTLST